MGARFYKMSGSGNDFVVFDTRDGGAVELEREDRIRAICARGTGVGADGVVLVEASAELDFRMRYFNADGTRAELCGNAALCAARLATVLGLALPSGMSFETDSGPVTARVTGDVPEIDLGVVGAPEADAGVRTAAGERRIGYARVGVPHLVTLCDDVSGVEVAGRGLELRRHPSRAPAGANANFVSRREDGLWAMRTYERGVEAETLACGTGAVACAILLRAWGESAGRTEIRTRSGERLTVTLRPGPDGGWLPTLAGAARLVFEGELGEIPG